MGRSRNGHAFEAEVIDALRNGFSCDIAASETLDHRKVDAEIRRVAGRRLKKRVQVQITMMIGHFAKLRDYIASRPRDADVISLYVEADGDRNATDVAACIAQAARETQRLEPYGRLPIFGLRIGEGATYFDPYARLRELRAAYESTERLRALKAGVAHEFGADGFMIRGEEGEYFAHYIDAFDLRFRKVLRTAQASVPVRFLPTGPGKASDVRRGLPPRR